jgi:hypothetical protein
MRLHNQSGLGQRNAIQEVPMTSFDGHRRSFLARLIPALGSLALVPMLGTRLFAGHKRRRYYRRVRRYDRRAALLPLAFQPLVPQLLRLPGPPGLCALLRRVLPAPLPGVPLRSDSRRRLRLSWVQAGISSISSGFAGVLIAADGLEAKEISEHLRDGECVCEAAKKPPR